jgi:hypothetical protein
MNQFYNDLKTFIKKTLGNYFTHDYDCNHNADLNLDRHQTGNHGWLDE